MRLLVMSSTFPDAALDGSRPRFVYDLAESLCDHANVDALVPHHPGAPTRERMGRVEVFRFRYWWPPSAEALTPNMREQIGRSPLARLQIPMFFLAQIATLRRHLARRPADVVNAHWLVPQGLSAALVRGRAPGRFRLALHVHAGDVYLLARAPLGRRLARFVISRANVVHASGSHVRDTLDRLLGFASNAQLQPMGVDWGLFASGAPEPPPEASLFPAGYLLFIGRFVAKKGAVYLLRALARVRESHPGLGLLLIGSGPLEPQLREETRQLGLDPAVRFLGPRAHEDVVTYLRHCRLVAVPSIVDERGETEGMPTVVTEALAAGTLVVGSSVNGIPDLIRHGENGWLCRAKDPDDIARKMLLALNETDASRIIRAGRRTAARLDWPALAREYFEALKADRP